MNKELFPIIASFLRSALNLASEIRNLFLGFNRRNGSNVLMNTAKDISCIPLNVIELSEAWTSFYFPSPLLGLVFYLN